jgi:predicted nucleic acid-binding protein
MAWVFDVSVSMAWCFQDEATPDTDALLSRLMSDPATVPQLWHLEVANVLTQAMRRKPKPRITPAQRSEFLALLSSATILVDGHTVSHAWKATLELADRYKLTTYDAAYLELAIRLDVELATLDRELRTAATAARLKVIP